MNASFYYRDRTGNEATVAPSLVSRIEKAADGTATLRINGSQSIPTNEPFEYLWAQLLGAGHHLTQR